MLVYELLIIHIFRLTVARAQSSSWDTRYVVVRLACLGSVLYNTILYIHYTLAYNIDRTSHDHLPFRFANEY